MQLPPEAASRAARPRFMVTLWQDKDKRRALLLSLFIHALALLLLIWLWARPAPVPLDTFLVIDVGTPELAEEQTDAPTVGDPAPQAAEPLVAAPEAGEPQATTPPEPLVPAEPITEEVEATPEPPAPEAASEPVEESEPEPVAEPEPTPEPVAESEPETQPEPATETQPEPTPEPVVEPEPIVESPPQPPAPSALVPETAPITELPDAEVIATTLPDIEEPELEPQPLAQAIPIPQPTPELNLSPARSVAITPTAQVTPEQAVPEPQVSAAVAQPLQVPQPQASASVATAQTIPRPQASAQVAAAQSVPTPQVSATVAAPQTVPQPQVSASVATAQPVPQPQIQASVTAAQTIPQPGAQASVTPGRSVTVTPQVQVSAVQSVPAPQVSATVAPAATAGSGEALTNTPTEAGLDTTLSPGPPAQAPVGGNAERSGQTSAEEGASESALGAAASPEGSEDPTGSPFTNVPYRENRNRPLAVMLDNVSGYPQAGLLEASMIVEMPVEGGLTRLMTVYDQTDPAQVGPVRSTRDYFHEIVTQMEGVLVHDGGSPAALAAIERSELPTINAYTSGELFERANGRSAPYNLYTQGTPLRLALSRLNLNRSSIVSGTVYRPESVDTSVSRVDVRFSGAYASAFRYVNDLNLYRWIRDGADASDAFGEAVYADAVIIASVEARAIPDDPEGRLYIPLRGGRATLYLRGKAIPGRWDPNGGVQFTTSLGDVVELAPFKTWVLFAPADAIVVEQ